MNITATITHIGVDSTVPDNPGAVDALIELDGVCLCNVTLLPQTNGQSDPEGELEIWGDPEHWCSDFGAIENATSVVGPAWPNDVSWLVREIVAAVAEVASN